VAVCEEDGRKKKPERSDIVVLVQEPDVSLMILRTVVITYCSGLHWGTNVSIGVRTTYIYEFGKQEFREVIKRSG